jgi:zinc/manganese transport system substrate-binding protein
MKMRSQYLRGFTFACATLGACTPHAADRSVGEGPSASGVRVVAIERVYGDLAQQLGGPGIDVTTILNSPTADPHAYEPTPRDADAIAAADVVIENGLGYDAFADKLIAASPHAGRVVLVVGTLGGHRIGDNPHVWYEVRSLRRFVDALATELARRLRGEGPAISRRHDALRAWLARFSERLSAIAAHHAATSVAITEPVFDYVLRAANVRIATPVSFSHAIEEGNDPAPQDVDTMRALLATRRVAAFVYNSQTVEPATTRLLDVAKAAGVSIVAVTETLPADEKTQTWIDREVSNLERAL